MPRSSRGESIVKNRVKETVVNTVVLLFTYGSNHTFNLPTHFHVSTGENKRKGIITHADGFNSTQMVISYRTLLNSREKRISGGR